MEDSILDILDLKRWNTEKWPHSKYRWRNNIFIPQREMHILFNHFILTNEK